jgi:hypothetical protein
LPPFSTAPGSKLISAISNVINNIFLSFVNPKKNVQK